MGPISPGEQVDPAGIGPEPESPGKASHTRGPSDTGLNRKGQLLNTADPQTRAGVTQDVWSTPRGLWLGLESPGTAGQWCGPSDPITSRPL